MHTRDTKLSAYFLETPVTVQNVYLFVPYLATSIVYTAAIDFVSKAA
jgi:hypothetical protein